VPVKRKIENAQPPGTKLQFAIAASENLSPVIVRAPVGYVYQPIAVITLSEKGPDSAHVSIIAGDVSSNHRDI
jgi:hypothetical protein